MYHKLRNVLRGLALASIAVAGGVWYGEPASIEEPTMTRQHAVVFVQVQGEGVLLETSDSERKVTVFVPIKKKHSMGDRGAFQMPFFSLAGLLSRVPVPPES